MYLWRLAVVVAAMFVSATAWSESGISEWTIINDDIEAVMVKFYGDSDREWDGGLIKSGQRKSYRLNCRAGEQVCYGAVNYSEWFEWFDSEDEDGDKLPYQGGDGV